MKKTLYSDDIIFSMMMYGQSVHGGVYAWGRPVSASIKYVNIKKLKVLQDFEIKITSTLKEKKDSKYKITIEEM